MIISVLAAAMLAGGAQNAPDQGYTIVDDVTVVATPIDPLLTVTVAGALRMESLVRSEPTGVRCGAREHRWADLGRPRLCWIRRPTGSEILLNASDVGAYGSDWRVEWRGCEPFDAGDRCRVTLTADETEVEAVFTRRR